MYTYAFYTHIILSLITLLSGLFTLGLAFIGYRKNQAYTARHRYLGSVYVVAIYLQLFIGILMYYSEGINWVENNLIDPGNSPTIRLWEIEHAAIMVFALFLVQIGYIFIGKTKSSRRKFILSFYYFGVPLLLMIFTMCMAMR